MKFFYAMFALSCAINALAAYNVFGVPLPWMASVLMLLIFLVGLFQGKLSRPPHMALLFALLGWTVVITVLHIASGYEELMPPAATSSYLVFVLLRVLDIMVFVATVVATFALCSRGYGQHITKFVVVLGSVASIAAIYMYLAQIWGWPEPPRTRLGTGGDPVENVVFSYAFHRALGTFREPSHLAEWLQLPFFLSAVYKRNLLNIHTLVICTALLLTGSMNGVIGLGVGLTVSLVLYNPLRRSNIKNFGLACLLLGMGICGFYLIAQGYGSEEFSLFGTIFDRLSPLIERGPAATNRDYVYEYVWLNPPPLFGYGAGNGNLVFANYLGSQGVASFLNIFVNAAYNLGVPGLLLTVVVVIVPVIDSYRTNQKDHKDCLRWFLAAYLACVMMLLGHTEVFNMQFGLAYALLLFEVNHNRSHFNDLSLVAHSRGNYAAGVPQRGDYRASSHSRLT